MKVARTIEGMGKRNSLPPRGPLLEQLETELPKIIDRIREAVGAGQAPPRPALGPAPVDLGPAPTDHLLAEKQLQQQQQLVKPRQTAAARAAAAAAARAAARKKADEEEAAGLAKVQELLANPNMVLRVEEQIMVLLACVAHGRRQAEAARDKAAIGTANGPFNMLRRSPDLDSQHPPSQHSMLSRSLRFVMTHRRARVFPCSCDRQHRRREELLYQLRARLRVRAGPGRDAWR